MTNNKQDFRKKQHDSRFNRNENNAPINNTINSPIKNNNLRKQDYDSQIYELSVKNIEKLKSIRKYDPSNTKDHYIRTTDGERQIIKVLKQLRIKNIRKYYIPKSKLKGDTMEYRLADFYLPLENIYIEFLAKWDSGEEEQKRYKEKMRLFLKNELICIYILPKDLFNLMFTIKSRIREITTERIGKN